MKITSVILKGKDKAFKDVKVSIVDGTLVIRKTKNSGLVAMFAPGVWVNVLGPEYGDCLKG